MIIISTLSLIIQSYFLQYFSFEIPANKVNQRHENEGIFKTILFSCILIPIVEELIFRNSLKYSTLRISISLAFISFFFLSNMTPLSQFLLKIHFTVKFSTIFMFFFIFYKKIFNNKLRHLTYNFWNNYPVLVFYTSFISFGFIHILNFKIESNLFIFTPIIVLPQLTIGIVLGYSRLKYGLFFSIIAHSIYNSLFTFMYILAKYNSFN